MGAQHSTGNPHGSFAQVILDGSASIAATIRIS
jgi:hypothetical protein